MRVSAATRSTTAAASSPSKPTLKLGSSGAAVKTLQQALASAGFSPGAADGQFGPKTAAAVKAFQSAKGLAADGVVGPKTWAALTAGGSGGATPTLKQGSKGAAVTNLQNLLSRHGFNPGPADGQFGPKTTAAVKAFQSAKGLTADGVVGPKTWARLNGAAGPSAPSAPGGSGPTLKQGHSGPPVAALQNRLNQLGFNAGAADGQFGPKTTAAVKAFQSAKGLTADGVVGPKTWNQLGITVSGTPSTPPSTGGVHGNSTLANKARAVALSMGGYSSQGLCATGVSRAIQQTYGIKVWGNGNQIDDNLPRNKFKQVNLSLAEALKIPGLILTWEKTSTRLGSIYGHTAITSGDGRSSYSDFVESNTLGASGRSGFKVFMPI
ncbi:peptidoglycan-binding domain-containing protein [Hyalangium gracile]|uniref:peptidoglycan-binding domain-containing protein n=1 Tax=Hyalangium gracile TaxID=394092 RepID=UPI00295F47FF|nr:peptidoglycan-binding protein [Hyalangium gracile]